MSASSLHRESTDSLISGWILKQTLDTSSIDAEGLYCMCVKGLLHIYTHLIMSQATPSVIMNGGGGGASLYIIFKVVT